MREAREAVGWVLGIRDGRLSDGCVCVCVSVCVCVLAHLITHFLQSLCWHDGERHVGTKKKNAGLLHQKSNSKHVSIVSAHEHKPGEVSQKPTVYHIQTHLPQPTKK